MSSLLSRPAFRQVASADSISWLKSGETLKDHKAGKQVYEFTAHQGYVNSPEMGSFVMSEKPSVGAQREPRKKTPDATWHE